MIAPRRLVAVAALLVFATGCQDLADGLGNGIDRAVTSVLLFFAATAGLLGTVGIATSISPKRGVGVVDLVLATIFGGGTIALLFIALGGLAADANVRASDFWIYVLPVPLALWPLWAWARFAIQRLAAGPLPYLASGIVSAAVVAFVLFRASSGAPRPLGAKIARLAMTDDEGYALLADGEILRFYGQAANAAPRKYLAIGASAKDACGLTTDSTIDCGLGSSARGPDLRGVRAIDLAADDGCALLTGDEVECWSLKSCREGMCAPPDRIEGLTRIAAVATGDKIGCALGTDGRVSCWTLDLARPWPFAVTPSIPRSALRIEGFEGASQLAVHNALVCVIDRDADVLCAGDDDNEESGVYPPATFVATPHRIEGVHNAVELALGDFHGCARDRAGAVSCWGGNGWGQLGDDRAEPHRAAARAVIPARAVALASSGTGTCALLDGGEAYCWGAVWRYAAIAGEKCSGGFLGLGPNHQCVPRPMKLGLPTSAVPLRPTGL